MTWPGIPLSARRGYMLKALHIGLTADDPGTEDFINSVRVSRLLAQSKKES